jgi:hypothetical protein
MSGDSDRKIIVPVMSTSILPFIDELGNEFTKRGYEFDCIPQTPKVAAAARSESEFADAYCFDLLDHTPDKSLESLADKYGIASARSFVFPQMIYHYISSDPHTVQATGRGTRYPAVTSVQKPHSYTPFIQWLHQCLDYCDQMFESGSGGNPVHYQGSEIIRRVLQRVADFHGYQSAWMGFSPIPGESGFYTDESSTWDSITNSSYDKIDETDRDRARQFIADFKESKSTIGVGKNPGPSVTDALANSKQIFRKEGLDGLSNIVWNIKRQSRRKIMSKYAKRKYHSYEESIEILNSSQYVFYPIQYYLESRVAMRAPAFFEQSWLIEFLSRSVPVGHDLIVKDHPQRMGALPKKAVDTISEYATPISPSVSAHDVIQNASAVVTLNNTVGYESVMYGKPVISLGESIYDAYTTKVGDINTLDERIATAIDSGGLDESEVIEFTNGLLNGSRKGVWRDTAADNVRNIVENYLSILEQQES